MDKSILQIKTITERFRVVNENKKNQNVHINKATFITTEKKVDKATE